MADINTRSLMSEVVKRFMSKEEFVSFLKRYNDASERRGIVEPNPSDFKIIKLLKSTRSITKTAKQLGISTYIVRGAAIRVSAWRE